MKFHVIRSRTYFGGNPNTRSVDATHASFFHGTADRGGLRPTSKNALMANPVDRPLQLHKNSYQIADVFSPEFALVVSAEVREAFRDMTSIAFVPVHFKTLYEVPYREGDFSFYKTIGDYFQIERFIDRQVDHPELHAKIGDYFELISPPARDFRERYELLDVQIRVGPRASLDVKDCPVSQELLRDVPIYGQVNFIMREDVFSRLEPFLNWSYFLHGEGEI